MADWEILIGILRLCYSYPRYIILIFLIRIHFSCFPYNIKQKYFIVYTELNSYFSVSVYIILGPMNFLYCKTWLVCTINLWPLSVGNFWHKYGYQISYKKLDILIRYYVPLFVWPFQTSSVQFMYILT